jgi:hypothetical protein
MWWSAFSIGPTRSVDDSQYGASPDRVNGFSGMNLYSPDFFDFPV